MAAGLLLLLIHGRWLAAAVDPWQLACCCRSMTTVCCVGERGLRRQELVNWYLTEMEGDIDSEQQLMESKMLTEMVIDRLIQHVSHHHTHHVSLYISSQDRVLLEVREEEEEEGDQQQQQPQKDPNPYLVVHPNYVIES